MFVEISGFFFLLIIVLLTLAGEKYGYEVFSELDVDTKLQKVNNDPKMFKTAISLVMFEHVVIISLAVTLFIAFGSYNILLGIIWLLSRSIEGLIQIINKMKFLGLQNIAAQYASSTDTAISELSDTTLSMLKSKNSTFTVAQLLFSIGTLAYSIVFVMYVPSLILLGWFGVFASIVYGLGNGIYRMKPNSKALWNLGGFLIFIFEFVLGGWFLFHSFFL